MQNHWLPVRQRIRLIWWVPPESDYRWQAREQNGYALTDFSLDWERQQARCPQGQISRSWTPERHAQSGDHQNQVRVCHLRTLSSALESRTRSRQRTLSVRRREAHVALETASPREPTEEFAEAYAQRAGIEGVHAEARSSDGVASFTLYRRTAHASATCGDRSCHQCVSVT